MEFYCGNKKHVSPQKMIIVTGQASPYYACPCMFQDKIPAGESYCPNRLNLIDAEDIYLRFRNIVESDLQDNIISQDYTNLVYKTKSASVKVIENDKKCVFEVLNGKVFR